MRLGFFPKFKGSDTVLLSGDAPGVRDLLDAIERAASSGGAPVQVNTFARTSAKHPAHLYLSSAVGVAGVTAPKGYILDVSDSVRANSVGLLQPLLTVPAGHQKFELLPRPVILLVSVGEYDDTWWEREDAAG